MYIHTYIPSFSDGNAKVVSLANCCDDFVQCRIVEQAHDEGGGDVESEANKTSQDVLNCLISIFVRMSSSRRKTMDLSSLAYSEESSFRDPYFNSSELKKRDVGAYKHLYVIEAHQVDMKRRANAAFLIRRLR